MQEQKKFAVFDIDGTVIRWQLFHAIVYALGKQGYITPEIYAKTNDARMLWKTRQVSFRTYEETVLQAYFDAIGHLTPAEFDAASTEVFAEYKDQTYVYTRDLIRSLKTEGYLIFAISGSPHEIVLRLAERLGIDDVIGAKLEQINSTFTGKAITPVHDKRTALNSLVSAHNATFRDSYGVGDSASDASMLEMVEHPIAFNPEQALFDIASEKGWPVVIERKNMIYELEPQHGTYQLKTTA